MAAAGLLALSSCTVRPLYGVTVQSFGPASGATAGLAAIAIKPANTRYEQEVRNHLVFMFGGGAGEPSASRYSLDLGVTSRRESVVSVQRTTSDNEPTAGAVRLRSRYTLTDTATGEIVASGERSVRSSYDIPRQRFAALRAERDAEDRAARELAEQLRLALAQNLGKISAR
ncbi:LPS assembly lipoprotein LptE [Mesorhizobium xinjiangense]|uniref:LPS assembly lipoprotein LptE n=1 Tax=Mesorhizobium xinjiangense TaxID=2678685 RepID=UPI001F192686|nr:LPS assembly lipoprotein LptE [Mesorhizobium xinjiangense]